MLAINWVNAATNNFDAVYSTVADPSRGQKAVEIVKRAIADWEAVITSFQYAEDFDQIQGNDLLNTYQLTINAGPLSNTGSRGSAIVALNQFSIEGKPKAGTVNLDDNAAGNGWFFDSTPRDDAEFSAIADAFSANFTDVGATYPPFGLYRDDFYRTVVHEIGHALGQAPFLGSAIAGMLSPLYKANGSPLIDGGPFSSGQLRRFQSTNPAYQITATYTADGHIYEGFSSDPAIAYLNANGTGGVAFQSHPNDLMNPGRSVPMANETTRQFISDLDAKILAGAYGYTVVLPSSFSNAFVSLD